MRWRFGVRAHQFGDIGDGDPDGAKQRDLPILPCSPGKRGEASLVVLSERLRTCASAALLLGKVAWNVGARVLFSECGGSLRDGEREIEREK